MEHHSQRHRFHCPELSGLPVMGPASATTQAAQGSGVVALSDRIVRLGMEESHQARNVLRLLPGQEIELFDGQGAEALGEIAGWAEESVAGRTKPQGKSRPAQLALVKLTRLGHELPLQPRIVVAVSMPKGSRAQDMIEQLSQVGADEVVPLLAKRTIVDPGEGKLERMARVALESAKQCGRSHVMRIGAPSPLSTVLRISAQVKLIASPRHEPSDLSKRLAGTAEVLVLIGPEGGWTDEELRQAADAGCVSWRLGLHVMRIETAAVVATALLRQHAER